MINSKLSAKGQKCADKLNEIMAPIDARIEAINAELDAVMLEKLPIEQREAEIRARKKEVVATVVPYKEMFALLYRDANDKSYGAAGISSLTDQIAEKLGVDA